MINKQVKLIECNGGQLLAEYHATITCDGCGVELRTIKVSPDDIAILEVREAMCDPCFMNRNQEALK